MPASSPELALVPEAAPLALEEVVCDLGGRRVLDGVTLPLAPGRITVLIGPSGVGKTVCVKHLCGLLMPTAGKVRVDGAELGQMKAKQLRAYRRGLGVMFQGSSLFAAGLFGSMNVLDNVAFGLRDRGELPDDEIRARALRRIEQVGLGEHADALPEVLSAGMVRRAAFARALVLEPHILLLDDIDSGLDGVRLRMIGEVLRDEQRATGATSLVTTHDPELARSLADVVAVLRRGRIDALGPPEEVLDRPGFGQAFLAGDPASGLGMAAEHVDEVDDRPETTQWAVWPLEGSSAWAAALVFAIIAVIAIAWIVVAAVGDSSPI